MSHNFKFGKYLRKSKESLFVVEKWYVVDTD